MSENTKEMEKRLGELLSTFNIPPDKRNDIEWLKANVVVKNTGHRDITEVNNIMIDILKEKNKERVRNFLK